jgi:3',5'-cyclic AMP phosphodiesterase CpdA
MDFLHLSDLHLTPPGGRVIGADPRQRVERVLARLRDLAPAPTGIIISGDLSDDGSVASYEVVKEVVASLGSDGTPVLLALGNHDDRATFRRVVLGQDGAEDTSPYCYSQTIDGLRVIVLDSTIPGDEGGAVGAAQLAWLDAELQHPAPRGSLIVLHHCCRLVAAPSSVARFVLRDVDELEAVVARHDVVGVLAGHSHQANSARFGGALYATAPAVLYQLDFLPDGAMTPVDASGGNRCQLRDGQLIVQPVSVGES